MKLLHSSYTRTSQNLAVRQFVTEALLPRWSSVGINQSSGASWDRIDQFGTPIETVNKRLLTQARVVFSFAEGYCLRNDIAFLDVARRAFHYMRSAYGDQNGGWKYAIGKENRDLYSHAFVMLACSALYRATGDPNIIDCATQTLEFIERNFKSENGGFVSTLDQNLNVIPGPLLQNPHMHLFEACCFLYDVTADESFVGPANKISTLFVDHFLDRKTGTLTENFANDWSPNLERGHILEPGHHFEWVWLLHRWMKTVPQNLRTVKNEDLIRMANGLLDWALAYGVDNQNYGIFDEVGRTGAVIKSSKRIWPLLEAIKAISVCSLDKIKDSEMVSILNSMQSLLLNTYFEMRSGQWTESVDQNLSPITDYLPATTLYHIVMATRELAWIEKIREEI